MGQDKHVHDLKKKLLSMPVAKCIKTTTLVEEVCKLQLTMDPPSSTEVKGQEPFQEKLLGLVWDESRLECDKVARGELM